MTDHIKTRIPVIVLLLSLLLSAADGDGGAKTAEDYYWSGKDKYHSGDYQGAIEDYDKAAELATGVAKIFGSRAAAKRRIGDREGALNDARKAARLGDKDARRILRILGYDW